MANSELKPHLEWLGYAQPVGLVVTAPALAAAQAWPDRNISEKQEVLRALVGEAAQLKDLRAFFITFLGWKETDFAAPVETQTVYLEEYKETLAADAMVVADGAAVAHILQIPNGLALDAVPQSAEGWPASPQTRFERLLRDTGVPLGVLSNGHALRIVYAPRGQSPGHVTFEFKALIEIAGRPLLSALVMLLDVDRMFLLPKERRLAAICAESRQYQGEVSTRLSEQVLEALHLLLRGIEEADRHSAGALLKELRRAEARAQLSEGLLTVVLRLIFLLYAEDRGLMPQSTTYVSSYSVSGLFEQLRDDEARHPESMNSRFGAWARLLTLFRLVFRGGASGDFQLPKRTGDLFDPDRFPFLEGRAEGDHFSSDRSQKLKKVPRVPDGAVLGVLRNLLMLDGERLSYRALDVEQIGSVYESMMGFELEVATGRSVAMKPAHVVVDLDALLASSGKKRTDFLKEEASVDVSGNTQKAIQAAKTVDDLVAALDRRLSPFTRQPLPKGSLYLQPGKERRRSGSHYTPRSLTEPIVKTTLEPMLKGLGPTPRPEQLLSLKVCDPAMGSGAFLVEACRHLGAALEESWKFHKVAPPVPPDEDLRLHACRVVAQKCLYGVDKNPMAVQLSKLSLWLFTLAKDHPFTFLDHALKAGDSLVGLTRTQVQRMTWESDEVSFTQPFHAQMERLVERGESLRLKIHDLPDPPDTAELRELNEAAESSLETARLIGHLTVAAFFKGGNAKAKRERVQSIAKQVQALFTKVMGNRSPLPATRGEGQGEGPELAQINMELRSQWEDLQSSSEHIPLRPFHWELEFPEVFGKGRDGFDSFVGNPPFSGKNGISEAGGDEYIPWLQTIHDGAHGNADLSAHFFRRTFGLLCDHGTFGLISTNTIAQGDTRATGLQTIVKQGGVIYAATRSMMWPGLANVAVSVVHVAKGRDREAVLRITVLDEKAVPAINSRLRGKPERPDPVPLKSNENLSFVGTYVLGMGFVLTPEERDAYVKKDKRNAERIFPYIGGEEVNTSPTQDFSRYVICFSEIPKKAGEKFRSLTEDEAKQWPDLYKHITEFVKPERMKLGDNADARKRKTNWWLYGRDTPALYDRVVGSERWLAVARVSRSFAWAFQSADRVPSEQLVVVTLDRFASFAVLQSRLHRCWAELLGSSMKEDLRYGPSDCFESFPFPTADPTAASTSLEDFGSRLYQRRSEYMRARSQGLTTTFNELKDVVCSAVEVVALRELHVELDRKVLEAYGWSDIPVPPYTTPETDAERAAFEAFEDEVLDRLFALNAKRASLESVAPSEAPPTKKSRTKKPTKSKNQPTLNLDPEE